MLWIEQITDSPHFNSVWSYHVWRKIGAIRIIRHGIRY